MRFTKDWGLHKERKKDKFIKKLVSTWREEKR